MLAFELPPHNSGGLGVACLGMTKALVKKGFNITFMLPKKLVYPHTHMKIIFSDDFDNTSNCSTSSIYSNQKQQNLYTRGYMLEYLNPTFDAQIENFTQSMVEASKKQDFSIIHVHDWMTFEAGIKIKELTDKPLIVHIHSTELDRSPEFAMDIRKYEIEKKGMHFADAVVVVSNYTKRIVNKYYNVPLNKIVVMYNAADVDLSYKSLYPVNLNNPLVVFLGRITHQKGPYFLLEAAKKTIKKDPKAIFVIVGNGDMYESMIEKACNYGLTGNIIFTNFLRGVFRDSLLKRADVFVMPSLSEPFGIVALEAAYFDTPIIVSKQSGVGEVLRSSIKVDFWDTDLLSKKIYELLRKRHLRKSLVDKHKRELKNITWETTTESLAYLYKKLMSKHI